MFGAKPSRKTKLDYCSLDPWEQTSVPPVQKNGNGRLSTQRTDKENFWHSYLFCGLNHYNDVIMGVIASQITSLTIVYSIVYSDADQRKHQSSASLAFVRGIHRGPVNSPHKWPVTRKMFPFDDVIMILVTRMGYSPRTMSIPLLLMAWQRKESGHQ